MAIPLLGSEPPPRLHRRRAAAPSRASLRGETQLAAFWASRPRPRLGSVVSQHQDLATAAGARAELAWCRWGGVGRFRSEGSRGGGRRGERSMGRGCRARRGAAGVVGSAGAERGRGGVGLAARTGGRRGALSQVAARRLLEGAWGGEDRPCRWNLVQGAYGSSRCLMGVWAGVFMVFSRCLAHSSAFLCVSIPFTILAIPGGDTRDTNDTIPLIPRTIAIPIQNDTVREPFGS